jgi:hypothetical protein
MAKKLTGRRVDGTLFKFDDADEVWHCDEPAVIPPHWSFWREGLTDKGTMGGSGSQWWLKKYALDGNEEIIGPYPTFVDAVQWARAHVSENPSVLRQQVTQRARFVPLKLTQDEADTLKDLISTALRTNHKDPGYMTPSHVRDCNEVRAKIAEGSSKFNLISS